ncbi:hypothetical protein Cpin_2267 [Chitinophaga pinensis DSM 2588]|uniref:Secreted protein n=1 Tax=Chitinophaga pinensis (strain ATCC 43595 / DSM 2588 / LMG 13176 / NBRC 15968 / NCIMB 11800 / UQM 2034) TaxID=485918 RepID=A0A979G389_CHIPD|nr:hypothetical protein Cpin_2267 [Chitinophaga pinensis DSM 2588]
MKYIKLNPTLVVFLFSAASAIASSKKVNRLDLCSTVPTTGGPSINAECPYSASVQCCYIAAGSSSQYVTQTQSSSTVTIRRNATSMVTIFGIRQ